MTYTTAVKTEKRWKYKACRARNVVTGEKITQLVRIHLGTGVMGSYDLTITHFGNCTSPSRTGDKTVMNWDLQATENANGTVVDCEGTPLGF